MEERGSPKGIRGPEGLAKDSEPKRRVEPAGTCTASKECGFVFRTPDRYYPREEPYEVVLHVRICAGGRPQGRSLPRPRFSCFRAAQNTKNGSDPACRFQTGLSTPAGKSRQNPAGTGDWRRAATIQQPGRLGLSPGHTKPRLYDALLSPFLPLSILSVRRFSDIIVVVQGGPNFV